MVYKSGPGWVRLGDRGTGRLPTKATLQQGRYVILQTVGKGGMGAVYLAMDTGMGDRFVAIKEMSQSRLRDQEALQRARQRFQQEAAILYSLDHPNLPHVHASFQERDRSYLVMDYIDGRSLTEVIKRTPGSILAISQVVQIGLQLCAVLEYLHMHQPPIIFRDLKPSNVMLARSRQVYLIDFGIARLFERDRNAGDTEHFGTPGYAPPEQGSQVQTSPRSDIYSLGATLHHCLTGRSPVYHPFNFPAAHERNPLVPLELSTLIQEMLALDPARRPASAQDVQVRLYALSQALGEATPDMAESDSGQIVLHGSGNPSDPTQVAGQTEHTIGQAGSTSRRIKVPYLQHQVSEIKGMALKTLSAASVFAGEQFADLKHALCTWSWSRDIWSKRFVTLFLTVLFFSLTGSFYFLKNVPSAQQIAGLTLLLFLLCLIGINLTSKDLRDPVPRSFLAGIALALILAGSGLQALPESEPILQHFLQFTTLNQVCVYALLAGAIVRLVRSGERLAWVDHLLLGLLAACCALLHYAFGTQEFAQFPAVAEAVGQSPAALLVPILSALALIALFRYTRQFNSWDRFSLLCVASAAALLQYAFGFPELQQFVTGSENQQYLVLLNVFLVFTPLVCALLALFINQRWLASVALALVTLVVAGLLKFQGESIALPVSLTSTYPLATNVLAITTLAQVINIALALLALIAFLRLWQSFIWLDHVVLCVSALTIALLDNALWQQQGDANVSALSQTAFNQQFGVISAQLPAFLIYLLLGSLLLVRGCIVAFHIWSVARPYAQLDPLFRIAHRVTLSLERLLALTTGIAGLIFLWFFSPLQAALQRWSVGLFVGMQEDIGGLLAITLLGLLAIMCIVLLVRLCQRSSPVLARGERFTLLLVALVGLLLFWGSGNISALPLLQTSVQLSGNFFHLSTGLLYLLILGGLLLAVLLLWFWLKRPLPSQLRELLKLALALVLLCVLLQPFWPFFLAPGMVIFIQVVLLVIRVERVG